MAKRQLVTDGVLVRLKAGTYWRNRATGAVYTGPTGRPATGKYRPGSPPFRIPAPLWERQRMLPESERIFIKVGEEDAQVEK